jgi:hypothetical protein
MSQELGVQSEAEGGHSLGVTNLTGQVGRGELRYPDE